ncbi:unnamed protein product [Ectocarpus sp. CCAP 1310/34]|nr:unnamed protein product [Ectocarpus sp. CCAP 1310/34]
MGVTEQTGQRGGRWADSQTYKNKGNSKARSRYPTQQSRQGGHEKKKHSTEAEGNKKDIHKGV